MGVRVNPFHELYVGESIGADKFVNLFSHVIVEHALSLFQPGHVILKGYPGAGKSMLLNLLKPSIRIAYANAGQKFPVPQEFMKFIGAGINLKRSGISDFGQRPIENKSNNEQISAFYFADFLNYWIISDIFQNISKLVKESPDKQFIRSIGINIDNGQMDNFVQKLVSADCWLGYLNEVNTFDDLHKKINFRITQYRSFLNYNIDDLPEDIHSSKTLIGIPISKTVELLKEFGIIDNDTEVYIRIDQYEELSWLDENQNNIGQSYCEMIHKLLGLRDPNVSYRIGTRHFAWTGDTDKKMFGSAARLEKNRNYTEISIDNVLKRKENQITWVFPKFAEDIFSRRIKQSKYKFDENSEPLIAQVFGSSMAPKDIALHYLPNDKSKAVQLETSWPKAWRTFLTKLADEDPLSARLGEAWARQKGKKDIVRQKNIERPFPWEGKWWKKERTEQALMQIASRNRQQLLWYGKDDILGLSGGHILVFLSICQHIWDVWIRDKRNEIVEGEIPLPSIDMIIQSAGIRETSSEWFDDISNEKGGKERKVFINFLGTYFHKTLSDDLPMSYPGHNGFSLTKDDQLKNKEIYEFIFNACDYGALYDAPHTSKSADKKPRTKWYISPILCPHFRIPYAHTKEPKYVNLGEVADWLIESGAFDKNSFVDIKRTERKSRKDTGGQGIIEFE